MRELSLLEAIREALAEEMQRDPRVVLLGEDIGRLGGVFRATDGLLDRFGPERVVDTPMAELSIAGMAVGLAMRGLRPVAEIQFADFIHAAADHLIGEAAKIRYRTRGDWTCPMVLRTAYGGGFRGGPYHSQSVEAFYAHAPGLKVVAPGRPADAKGLLVASVRDPDPVVFLEHKLAYRKVRGPVPEGEHLEELGKARVAREGDTLTLVAYGMMLHECLAAAERLADHGIECEVIDLRTLLPLDRGTVLDSVRRTGRLCVVHEDTLTMGLGAEIAAIVCESAFDQLRMPPIRVATPDVPGIPVSDPLEDALIPNAERIVQAVLRAVERRPRGLAAAPLSFERGGILPPSPPFDAATPSASSVVEVRLGEQHVEAVLSAVAEACRAHPSCNAAFTWEGVHHHPEVRVDLDCGPLSPPRGDGTFTIVDYGPGSSWLGLPAVRPGQTAALRVGAVRDGRALLALTVDHRAVDGAEAGRFLALVKRRLVSPDVPEPVAAEHPGEPGSRDGDLAEIHRVHYAAEAAGAGAPGDEAIAEGQTGRASVDFGLGLPAMRRRIAERMQEARAVVVQGARSRGVDLSTLRRRGSWTAYFVKALALAGPYSDVGVAVELPDGLLVPVVRSADRRDVAELSFMIGDLAERARERRLAAADVVGGEFTVTNVGGTGTALAFPLVNPGQPGILAPGAVVDGRCLVTLCYDRAAMDEESADALLGRVAAELASLS